MLRAIISIVCAKLSRLLRTNTSHKTDDYSYADEIKYVWGVQPSFFDK